MKIYTLAEIIESIDKSADLHLDEFKLPHEMTCADHDISVFVEQRLFVVDGIPLQTWDRLSAGYYLSLNT